MANAGAMPGPFPNLDAPKTDWANAWKDHGFDVIPLVYAQKRPIDKNWPNVDYEANLEAHFGQLVNVGVRLGKPCGNTDIDLDAPEAARIWSEFGPATNLRWGRSSKPNSHWLYRADPPGPIIKFEDTISDPTGKKTKITLLEIRGLKKDGEVGLQTMCPPSIHPSGERVRFEPGGDGEPANVEATVLYRAAHWTAAATILVRNFPGESGGRHDVFLALAGILYRGGWTEDNALLFIRGMYRGLWDAQADFAAAAIEVSTTYAKAREDGAVTGYARLSELIDAKVLSKAFTWLDLTTKTPPPDTNTDGRAAKFSVTDTGVYYDGGEKPELVCMPALEVLSTASSSQADEWGRVLRWRDVRGNVHVQVVPMEHVGDSTVYRQELKRQGLLIREKRRGRDLLAEYITFSVPKSHVRLASRTGWEEPGKIYVLPDGAICAGSLGDEVLFHAPGMGEHFYAVRGTLPEWREHVGSKAIGNSRLSLAISTAFAAPLLALTDMENGGFHFKGLTSVGKTTIQVAAGSVFGGGGIRGFVRTWNATANGVEAMCHLHNDSCLMLDEIKQIDPKNAENVVYMICNAMGKNRMTRQITARTSLSWRVLFLSSGELGLAEHVQAAGNKAASIKGGADVRLINIPADAGKGMGAFEDLHGASSAGGFAKALVRASKEYYGTPIRAFVRELIDDLENAMEVVRDTMDRFMADLEEDIQGAAPEVRRALGRFALVAAAGELATQYGITGWSAGDAREAAKVCFEAWRMERGGSGSVDLERGVRQVQAFIQAHGPSRFQPLKEDCDNRSNPIRPHINDRAGYWTHGKEGREYLILTECFRNEVCAHCDYKSVAQELIKRGYLLKGNDPKHPYTRQARTPDGPNPVWVFWLRSTVWSETEVPTEQDQEESDDF